MSNEEIFEGLQEECGVFGIAGSADQALPYTILGLHAIQHRGQEGAGIVTRDETGVFHGHHRPGLVSDIFAAEKQAQFNMPGHSAIGHVRYSTAGSKESRNLQPLMQRTKRGFISVSHNGNITNADTVRAQLLAQGSLFQTDADTEILLHLISKSDKARTLDAVIDALNQIRGAYSLVLLTEKRMIGIRDPHGMRPLTLGKLDQAYILASESCAIEAVGGQVIRDVQPGEIVEITNGKLHSHCISRNQDKPSRLCVFEYIYFMRPNTSFAGRHAASVREVIGAELAKESREPIDVVVPVPESGVHAAVGYAQASNVPFKWGILKSAYIGRTFIEPAQSIRNFGVRLKLSIDRSMVEGKRVALVDDSIVRSTTMAKLVELVRDAGATEVHVRISSPPFRFPCFYGIDTPERSELIAAIKSVDEIGQIIGADSLTYLSLDGLANALKTAQNQERDYCHACFSGHYPVPLIDKRMTDSLKGAEAVIEHD